MSDNALTTTSDNGGKATAIYILYLAGFITGGVTTVIGLIMAYVFQSDAPDWLVSHYLNAIHVFWKSFAFILLAVPAIVFLAITVIGIPLIVLLGIGLAVVLPIWFIVRCVKGLHYLSQGQPYPNYSSWGF